MVDVVGRIDGWWNDLRLEVLGADPPPQVIGVRFPESWSSTSLAKKRCQKHRQDIFVLDTAFTLIDGHLLGSRVKGKPDSFRLRLIYLHVVVNDLVKQAAAEAKQTATC